jgi:hypothetical protein
MSYSGCDRFLDDSVELAGKKQVRSGVNTLRAATATREGVKDRGLIRQN